MNSLENGLERWRSTYGEWVLADLELRVARQRDPAGRAVAILEEKVRRLKHECSAVQDSVSRSLRSQDRPSAQDRAE